ncbi:hypothetical protein LJC61_05330 [Ruminococcaceae bacterium OttesenSCG-928-A16]|nr:hypothetical protein [Ruminococcaceae bacterium OttesenSCG-928-A16]
MIQKFKNWFQQLLGFKLGVLDALFLLALTIVFFTLPVFTAPDSIIYIQNAHVLGGQLPFSSWQSIRGPLLPALLRISFALFGESATGTAVLLYIAYLCMVVGTLYLCHLVGFFSLLKRAGTWALCTILVFLNPVILTYSHFVLTEFFALVLCLLAFCLIIKTQQLLLRPQTKRAPVLAARYIGTLVFIVGAFALKQMFFIFVLAPFLISEVYVLIGRISIKQIAASVLAAVMLSGSIFAWSAGWDSYIAGRAEMLAAYSAASMSSSVLIDGLRYFRPEERGTTGKEVRINIVNNNEEIIGSFTYTFKGTFIDSLQFLFTCLSKNPGRFFTSYLHNYFVVSNVRKTQNYAISRAYSPVTSTNYFFQSFETQAWLETFKEMEKGKASYSQPLAANMQQFNIPADNGLISNVLFNTHYPTFSYFLYSFPAFMAPFIFLLGIVMSIIRRKTKQKFAFWAQVTLLAGSIFGSILFLALTASSIDRYGFPSSIWSALLLALLVIRGVTFSFKKLAPFLKKAAK